MNDHHGFKSVKSRYGEINRRLQCRDCRRLDCMRQQWLRQQKVLAVCLEHLRHRV